MIIKAAQLLLDRRRFLLQHQEAAGAWAYPCHGHAGYAELFYLEQGVLDHVVGDRRDHLEAGSLVLVRPQDRHLQSGSGLTHWNLSLRESELARAVAFLSDGSRLRKLLEADAPPSPVVVPPGERAGMVEALRRLERRREQVGEERGYELLLVDLLQRVVAGPQGVPGARQAWLERVMVEAAAALDRASPAQMARRAGVSEAHLSRTMRRQVGSAPSAWLNRLRLERAALRLSEGREPIATIAVSLGFRQASYFSRLFSRSFGLSPAAYRASFARP